MSGHNWDENALKNNIETREFELLSLLDEDNMPKASGPQTQSGQCAACRGPCACNNQLPQNRLMHINTGNQGLFMPIAPPCLQSGYHFNVRDGISAQGGNINASGSIGRAISYGVNASKVVPPNMKKFKNKKKNFYAPKSTSQTAVDFANIVVNLNEIGLGMPRVNVMDCLRLKLKFRQLHIYLTSLCKERVMLEKILFAKNYNFEGIYVLPTTKTVGGHLEYTLNSLSIEFESMKSIVCQMQQRCDDSLFLQMYSGQLNNLLSAINMLSFLKGLEIFCETNNAEVIRRYNDVLVSLIMNVRNTAIIYTICGEKLLAKQSNALRSRRKMFIGH